MITEPTRFKDAQCSVTKVIPDDRQSIACNHSAGFMPCLEEEVSQTRQRRCSACAPQGREYSMLGYWQERDEGIE